MNDRTAREVLTRVNGALGLCQAMLGERLTPSERNLRSAARLLERAADFAAGIEPEDID
jgi:hypothetical protein